MGRRHCERYCTIIICKHSTNTHHQQSDSSLCEFTDAIKRHLLTKVEESKRLREGTNDQHRQTRRRNQKVLQVHTAIPMLYQSHQCLTLVQKILHTCNSFAEKSNRLRAIDSTSWNEASKEKARAVQNDKAYHSLEYSESDNPDDDADSAGPSRKKKIVVQMLPWQRSWLKRMKADLDEQYPKGLSSRAKGMITERERSGKSTHQPPQSASKHDWAVRLENNTSLLDASTQHQQDQAPTY